MPPNADYGGRYRERLLIWLGWLTKDGQRIWWGQQADDALPHSGSSGTA